MDKKTIGLRLKSLVLSEGITQKEFAKRVNFSDKYISDIIRGRTAPSLILLERIKSVFNVSMDWLLTGKGPPTKGLGESLLREGPEGYGEISDTSPRYISTDTYRDTVRGVSAGEDLITLPILSHEEALQLAEGHTKPVVDVVRPDTPYCTLYKKWLSSPKDTVCIRVLGNSMEPILKDGSIVAINTSLREPTALVGQLCAIKVKDVGAYRDTPKGAYHDMPSLSIRRLRTCEPYLVFMPQKEGHPVYCFSPQEPNPIIGRVEGAWTRF
ncbi:MAG: helix-turn-helix domain-containing protein [Candidatus Brocadiales bacterium]|nr:helix-turn-helix domain-containing protein [Candidatus Brocadiales bacterium]